MVERDPDGRWVQVCLSTLPPPNSCHKHQSVPVRETNRGHQDFPFSKRHRKRGFGGKYTNSYMRVIFYVYTVQTK